MTGYIPLTTRPQPYRPPMPGKASFVVEARKPRGSKWKIRLTTINRTAAQQCANDLARFERVAVRVVERRPPANPAG